MSPKTKSGQNAPNLKSYYDIKYEDSKKVKISKIFQLKQVTQPLKILTFT